MQQDYVGSELMLFQHATTWKNYFGKALQPYIKGDVLEVGAGMGGTTPYLLTDEVKSWTCLEPDTALAASINDKILTKKLPAHCLLITGTLEDVSHKYNTILYIDVIEHIEDDKAELQRAREALHPGGNLIVLVPAFQMMFSEFDKAIGHYRRYTKPRLRAAAPPDLVMQRMFYLDSIGLAASLINKMVLKQSYPTHRQIRFWDGVLVSMSKLSDKLVMNSFGKSLIGIWQKP